VLINAVQERLAHLGIAPTVLVVPDQVRLVDVHMDLNGTTFGLDFADGRRWRELRIPAVGALVHNLATAITAVESLTDALSESQVREIAATLSWPGRGQVLSSEPFVLLDAGVRPESVADLLTHLGPFHWVILSVPDGKDRIGMVEMALNYAERIVLTGCSNRRLAYHFENDPPFPRTHVISDVKDALSEVLRRGQPGERILLCGTISFVADVYRHYGLTVG
jgi:folylpolyglutamate synthase/dihydropteroate synthase